MRRLVLALLLTLLAGPAAAERLVTAVSDADVEITSSFEGTTLALFGNIEPSMDGGITPPYQVILAVEGPRLDRVARRKTNNFGIWLNTEEVVFAPLPSYFHVISSDRLANIADIVTLTVNGILPDARATSAAVGASWWQGAVFARQLVRLLGEDGAYRVRERGIQFLSETAFTARIELPSSATNGRYIVRTFVFRGNELVLRHADSFYIRKTGFERFLATSATQQPLLYGIACVLLALGTGWLGGWIFKR